MKILIYISSLTAGGAEKVASMMANYWCNEHEIVLLTDTSVDDDFFEIYNCVTRRSTNYSTNSNKNILLKIFSHTNALLQLRKILKEERPDVIISHMDASNVKILLAACCLNIPVIIEEHNNPKLARKMPQPWRGLQFFTYHRLAKYIVLLTKDLLPAYPKYLHDKIVYIPNPLNIPKNLPQSEEIILKQPCIVSMGSLRDIKGFDLLIKAFSIVVKKHPHWNLIILGEGSERENLTKLVEEFGIEKNIDMPGRITEPYGILKNADIYVLSSRSEAFPVALCEAMGLGLPCISFDCPTGPSLIIDDQVNGLLVEYLNVEALANAMIILIEDSVLREKFSSEAIKINESLNIDVIMKQWESLILESIGE